MKKIVCGKCEHEKFINLNPDESKCEKCGHIHEKLSDYKLKES